MCKVYPHHFKSALRVSEDKRTFNVFTVCFFQDKHDEEPSFFRPATNVENDGELFPHFPLHSPSQDRQYIGPAPRPPALHHTDVTPASRQAPGPGPVFTAFPPQPLVTPQPRVTLHSEPPALRLSPGPPQRHGRGDTAD